MKKLFLLLQSHFARDLVLHIISARDWLRSTGGVVCLGARMKEGGRASLLLLALGLFAGCATRPSHPALQTGAGMSKLIPVRDFVANRGSNWGYRISPDGKKLAWLAVQGVKIHLFIKDLERGTTHSLPMVNFYGSFEWAQDSRRLIYAISRGDESSVYLTFDTAQTGDHPQAVIISPWNGVKAWSMKQIAGDTGHIWISHNERDSSLFDLYKVDIDSRKSVLVAKNPGSATEALIDVQGVFRGFIEQHGETRSIILQQADSGSYKPVYRWSSDDSVSVVSIVDGGSTIYLLSNKGRDRKALLALSTRTGEESLVYEAPRVDVSSVYIHPDTGKPLVVFAEPDYPMATVLDERMRDVLAFLRKEESARFEILSSDRAFRRLTFSMQTEKGTEWYLYDMEKGQLERLGATPSMGFKDDLAVMEPVEISSRDDIPLYGYLTLPKGVAARGLPLVLLVHGGPWMRDSWGYNSEVQFLANRGYAVLQINYRGSQGYGRRFEELAIGEFAGKMQDDLLDGVQWAIDRGIADPQRIAIVGSSYGGYATLVGMSATPDTFACGIDIFGPSDLVKLVEDFPPYWKFEFERWYRYAGNPHDPSERARMQSKSPLFHAERISKPLLVIQGGMDVRVRPYQSEALVERLKRADKQVEYWYVPNAGHGLIHWPQRMGQFRRTEDFLAACLGGRSGRFDYYQLGAWLF